MGWATDLSPNEPEDEPGPWAAQVEAPPARTTESAKHSLAYRISAEVPFSVAGCDNRDDAGLRLRIGFACQKRSGLFSWR
jgi:hypothetical protein